MSWFGSGKKDDFDLERFYEGSKQKGQGVYEGETVTVFDKSKKNIKNNVRQGVGKCTWYNGSVYNGEWFDNKRSGSGT